jgi:folate-dependent phosphoribosylglycinamide formyltransferase PurN
VKRIIILTGSELRHRFFRKAVASHTDIDVVRTYCFGMQSTLVDVVGKMEPEVSQLATEHLETRARSERDFFEPFDRLVADQSNPTERDRRRINHQEIFEEASALDPDILVAFGCPIIKEPLLSAYDGRFVNVHLGLSPYYRGGGTNFWALVNGEPEFVGATFMHIDAGVDTGETIHQVRARFDSGDTPHQIGNRLIADMTIICAAIISRFDRIPRVAQIPEPPGSKVYRRRDMTEEAIGTLYRNFSEGLVDAYLAEEASRCAAAPIVENPAVLEPVSL